MQIAGVASAVQVVGEVIFLVRALTNICQVGADVQILEETEPTFARGAAVRFSSSQPFLTPVIMAKVNIAVQEDSRHASG